MEKRITTQEQLLKEIATMEDRLYHISQQEDIFKVLGKGLPFDLEDERESLEIATAELYAELKLH